jgi:hypothetical protein
MDFVTKLLTAVILTIATVMVITTILTFFAVPPYMYNPYMYYFVAIVVLWVYLPQQPLSIIKVDENTV